MFATSLLPLPPPSTSLLPTLSPASTEPAHSTHPHYAQARRKPTHRLNTPLISLSNDERLIASRKLAIAMYGYSWLKPAGCTKTMLGRREEELEREEVERQLREVELQERMAMEQEEQERRENLQRQADEGEIEGVGERNLDDEVPEAEEDADVDGRDSEDGGEGEDEDAEDMEGDLDDEIPDADTEGQESSWVYDTRREADTDTEDDNGSDGDEEDDNQHMYPRQPRNIHPRHHVGPDDPVATEALVNAMLDEDELGEYEQNHDLDDDIPDMDDGSDIDADVEMGMDMDMDADLSDAVPSATSSPGWEHTDSELEESEMDISLLPPHPNSSSRNPGTTHEEIRRVSGNRMLPPSFIPSGQSRNQPQQPPHLQQQPRTGPRRNVRIMMQTPGTADDVSALISTGATSTIDTGVHIEGSSIEPQSPNRRSWLNPAGARRNLFSGFRGTSSTTTTQTPAQAGSATQPSQSQGQVGQEPRHIQPRTAVGIARNLVAGVSSGGLFTPSPRQGVDDDEEAEDVALEEPRSRTRSGRLLGGLQVSRRSRRVRDGYGHGNQET